MDSLEIVQSRKLGELFEVRLPLQNMVPAKEVSAMVYAPRHLASDAPVIVVMHGVTRASSLYLSSWMPLADRDGFLLVVPRFSKKFWPGARSYNLGNIRNREGAGIPERQWAFTVLEDLVDQACALYGNRSNRFSLYGHSAGAQFVHRYLMFRGGGRMVRAVAANAGWYTLPSRCINYPYGLKGVNIPERNLHELFATPLTLILGSEDTDTRDPDLRNTPEAMAQGPHRLARGRNFYDIAQRECAARGWRFNWSIREIADCGHNDRHIASIGAECLQASDPINPRQSRQTCIVS